MQHVGAAGRLVLETATVRGVTAEDDRERRLRAACTRWLRGHGDRGPAALLAELPSQIEPDLYGAGGVVAELESEVAQLLGSPAAVFMPSGTMAQQIALRIHADRRGRRTVAFHPTCHLELHEGKAYQRLHGLVGRQVGDSREPLTAAELESVAEPLAALVVELPQREIGGILPEWDDLVAQVSWARDRGAAVHLDGARLWECGPAYGRPLAEIAGLFDTTYVSFYKGLGALSGSCLAGPADVVAEAREWRSRHGGTLFALWPYAASALAALRSRLPRMDNYLSHMVDIASTLDSLDGVEVVPRSPQVPMVHLYLRTTAEAFHETVLRIAEEQRIWTWQFNAPADKPCWRVVELPVGDATLQLSASEVRDLVALFALS